MNGNHVLLNKKMLNALRGSLDTFKKILMIF